MAKRRKQHEQGKPNPPAELRPIAVGGSSHAMVAHPPAKNPSLLGVSIVLFVLWFVFLLVTALGG